MHFAEQEFYRRSCADCLRYVHDERGRIALTRRGDPYLNPAPAAAPCHRCPKTVFGKRRVRAEAVEPTPQTYAAVSFYFRCRAVMRFPDDPIVAFAAGIIRRVEDDVGRSDLVRFLAGIRPG